jgi:hypothetical protein
MTPGRKFCTNTSASRASARTMAWPSGSRRFTASDRFPRLQICAMALTPPRATPTQRPMSPTPGASTLISSAPLSHRMPAAQGPASAMLRSTILMP